LRVGQGKELIRGVAIPYSPLRILHFARTPNIDCAYDTRPSFRLLVPGHGPGSNSAAFAAALLRKPFGQNDFFGEMPGVFCTIQKVDLAAKTMVVKVLKDGRLETINIGPDTELLSRNAYEELEDYFPGQHVMLLINGDEEPRPNLLLHCGGRAVARGEVQRIPTPSATETWTPIPHLDLFTQVERTLNSNGLVVGTQEHSLSHEGQRYFGLMEIQRSESADDYCWVLGFRNSHHKTFPAGITAGASVFVCDNLSFRGR
jgi:hemin uptake protein HemP